MMNHVIVQLYAQFPDNFDGVTFLRRNCFIFYNMPQINNLKIHSRSMNLRKTSLNKKSINPVRRHSHHGCKQFSILIIGDDLLWQILNELKIADVIHLRMSCKRLYNLTTSMGKRMFHGFIANQYIALTDDYNAAFVLYYQTPRSPFQNILHLAHNNYWYSQLQFIYIQYIHPNYCFICNYKPTNNPISCINLEITVVSEWHISLCSICKYNAIYSKASLLKKHPNSINIINLLQPFVADHVSFYFYPAFLAIIEILQGKQPNILSNLQSINETTCKSTTFNRNIVRSESNLSNTPTSTDQVINWSNIGQFMSSYDEHSWKCYNELCTSTNPMYDLFLAYPNVLLYLVINHFCHLDHANFIYEDAKLYLGFIQELQNETLFNDKPLFTVTVCNLVEQLLLNHEKNDMEFAIYCLKTLVTVNNKYPNITIYCKGTLIGPIQKYIESNGENGIWIYMNMIQERINTVNSLSFNKYIPLLNCTSPNYKRCKMIEITGMDSVDRRIMHWIYDEIYGGNILDLKLELKMASIVNKQEIRKKLVWEKLSSLESIKSSLLYFKYVFLLKDYTLEQVLIDIERRNRDLKYGKRCNDINNK